MSTLVEIPGLCLKLPSSSGKLFLLFIYYIIFYYQYCTSLLTAAGIISYLEEVDDQLKVTAERILFSKINWFILF